MGETISYLSMLYFACGRTKFRTSELPDRVLGGLRTFVQCSPRYTWIPLERQWDTFGMSCSAYDVPNLSAACYRR